MSCLHLLASFFKIFPLFFLLCWPYTGLACRRLLGDCLLEHFCSISTQHPKSFVVCHCLLQQSHASCPSQESLSQPCSEEHCFTPNFCSRPSLP